MTTRKPRARKSKASAAAEPTPQPMSAERLAEWRFGITDPNAVAESHEVAELVAEIDRLRAELVAIKKLTITCRDGKCPNCGFAAEDCANWKDTATEMERLRAELAAKDAEIARLGMPTEYSIGFDHGGEWRIHFTNYKKWKVVVLKNEHGGGLKTYDAFMFNDFDTADEAVRWARKAMGGNEGVVSRELAELRKATP